MGQTHGYRYYVVVRAQVSLVTNLHGVCSREVQIRMSSLRKNPDILAPEQGPTFHRDSNLGCDLELLELLLVACVPDPQLIRGSCDFSLCRMRAVASSRCLFRLL